MFKNLISRVRYGRLLLGGLYDDELNGIADAVLRGVLGTVVLGVVASIALQVALLWFTPPGGLVRLTLLIGVPCWGGGNCQFPSLMASFAVAIILLIGMVALLGYITIKPPQTAGTLEKSAERLKEQVNDLAMTVSELHLHFEEHKRFLKEGGDDYEPAFD